MPKVGGRRKKVRSHREINVELQKQLPRIFVVKRGDCPSELEETVHDLRKCFYPNTALKLQDSTKITLKAYLKTARQFNVTHLVALQHNNNKNFLRIIKLGGGQMRFRIVNYCRMKDVLHHGGQPFSMTFKNPLSILNGFSVNSQTKMIGRSIQEMFPPINPQKIKPESLKRVVSFTYNPNKKFIYLRHYKVVIHDGGVDRSFGKLLEQKNLDLSKFSSIGQYLSSIGGGEQESGQNHQKVKLIEMGPRMKLKFISYTQKSGQVNLQGEYQQEEAQQIEKPEGAQGDEE